MLQILQWLLPYLMVPLEPYQPSHIPLWCSPPSLDSAGVYSGLPLLFQVGFLIFSGGAFFLPLGRLGCLPEDASRFLHLAVVGLLLGDGAFLLPLSVQESKLGWSSLIQVDCLFFSRGAFFLHLG